MEVEENDEKWDRMKVEISMELASSTNPNAEGINVGELRQEDLVIWQRVNDYNTLGEGLTPAEFAEYSDNIMAVGQPARGRFRAYLYDMLTSRFFYPEYFGK